MADLIIREHAPGRWIVGRPTVRDGRVHVTGRTRWLPSSEKALEKARDLLEATDTPEPAEGTETKRATDSQLKPFDYRPWLLKPQAKELIRLMVEGGGVTTLEAMHAGIGRPSARVLEIRSVYGDDAVPKTWEKTSDGRRYARYHWRGPDSVQIEMSEDAA